jgi:type I restriction enzyme S subunit
MGSDRLLKIGDIAEVFDGPHATPKKIEEGPYFLSISSLENGQLDLSKSARLSEEQFVKWTRRVTPREGDVLFSYETRLGEAALMPPNVKACLGRRMGLLRPNRNRVLPEYLLYAYIAPEFQEQIKSKTNHGATVERIALKELPDFDIRIPSLEEQAKVVNVLSKISRKLEVNHQTNQTLEQMAQALFKSWFVDFDPVIDNALAAGNPIPDELQARAELRQRVIAERATNPKLKPLPDDIQQLFPSEFEESELGWIPKGWFSGALASLVRYSTSRMDGSELTLENYISTENMLTNKQGVTKASSIPSLKSAPSFITGQVLISNIRPYFKKIWLASSNGGRSNDVLGFELLEPKTEAYLMNLLSQDQFFDFMMTTSKGSKMPRGDKKAIMDWRVVVPPVKIRKFYSNLVGDFYSANSIRSKENDSLVQLRDTLLPKLISGELEVSKQHKEVVHG